MSDQTTTDQRAAMSEEEDDDDDDDPNGDAAPAAVAAVKPLLGRVLALRPVRVLLHFGTAQGPILASGMAFQSLFAIFAAIWVGFSVAGIFLASNEALVDQLISIINQSVPGLIGDGGLVQKSTLLKAGTTFSWTGIVALAGLIWKAIGWLATTRSSIRLVFDVPQVATNFLLQKVRDLGLAALFGVLLIASALVSLIITGLATQLLDLVGVDSASGKVVVQLLSILISTLVNMVALGGMYRVLSRVAIPFRRLAVGALIGGIGLTVLSQASGLLLGGASRNPLLAPFAVIVGLLIWFNFVCQVILISASWIAVGMNDAGIPPIRLSAEDRERQRAEEEREARLTLARSAVEDAQTELREAHGFARWSTKRRLKKARAALDQLEGSGTTE